jgi:mono/diheme cytochrome c family protein
VLLLVTSSCGSASQPSAGTTPATTTVSTAAPQPSQPVSAALLAKGKQLFSVDSCSSCHTLTGAVGTGPPLNGLIGSTVYLTSGKQITADSAYVTAKITNPDVSHIMGFDPVMAAAIRQYNLNTRPDDVRALVAYISAQK